MSLLLCQRKVHNLYLCWARHVLLLHLKQGRLFSELTSGINSREKKETKEQGESRCLEMSLSVVLHRRFAFARGGLFFVLFAIKEREREKQKERGSNLSCLFHDSSRRSDGATPRSSRDRGESRWIVWGGRVCPGDVLEGPRTVRWRSQPSQQTLRDAPCRR